MHAVTVITIVLQCDSDFLPVCGELMVNIPDHVLSSARLAEGPHPGIVIEALIGILVVLMADMVVVVVTGSDCIGHIKKGRVRV